ncbi:hypothetical protein, partial [Archangium sp.]|uniref:hypothetical protein n=1 Tax=Archangium sp. TaxID=1872627 RepID=UPI002ED99351
KLATFSGAVGLVIDIVGEAARVVLWGSLMGQMGAGPGAQPPAQGGGQVIPFPARPPPDAPPAQVPAAASMPLPH